MKICKQQSRYKRNFHPEAERNTERHANEYKNILYMQTEPLV